MSRKARGIVATTSLQGKLRAFIGAPQTNGGSVKRKSCVAAHQPTSANKSFKGGELIVGWHVPTARTNALSARRDGTMHSRTPLIDKTQFATLDVAQLFFSGFGGVGWIGKVAVIIAIPGGCGQPTGDGSAIGIFGCHHVFFQPTLRTNGNGAVSIDINILQGRRSAREIRRVGSANSRGTST